MKGAPAPAEAPRIQPDDPTPPSGVRRPPRSILEAALFTPNELDTLISLVEMTLEEAEVSFADWLESNPDELATLESLDVKLRTLERGAPPQVGPRSKTSLATLQLLGTNE